MTTRTILMLNHNLVRRGTFFRCLHFGRSLASAGYDVTILTASDKPRLRSTITTDLDSRICVIETPRFGKVGQHDGGWAPVDILFRIGHVLRHHYDVVYAFDHRPNVSVPWFVSKMFRKSLYLADWADWWCRGGILTSRRSLPILDHWEGHLEEGVKHAAAGVTVTSRVLHARAKVIGIPEERLLYLPSGADVERIEPMDKSECRKTLGIPNEARVIDFVGHSLWDLEFLIEAFRIVSNSIPNTILHLIGSDWKEMKGAADAKDSRLNIRFAGQVLPEQLALHLGAADVHALPMKNTVANQARGPIKLGDYMASGRPIVTQPVGDSGRVVADEEIGIVTGATPKEFAKGLLALLNDPTKAGHFGRKAREAAVKRYTWEMCTRPLIEFIERLGK